MSTFRKFSRESTIRRIQSIRIGASFRSFEYFQGSSKLKIKFATPKDTILIVTTDNPEANLPLKTTEDIEQAVSQINKDMQQTKSNSSANKHLKTNSHQFLLFPQPIIKEKEENSRFIPRRTRLSGLSLISNQATINAKSNQQCCKTTMVH